MKLTLRHPGAAAAPAAWIPLELAGTIRPVATPRPTARRAGPGTFDPQGVIKARQAVIQPPAGPFAIPTS